MTLLDADSVRQFDRLPPHDLDAELCVLGTLILCGDDSAAFAATRAVVRSEMFYQADHQIVFDTLCRMADRGQPIDAVLLRAELERQQVLAEIGGTESLARCLHAVPSS